MSFCLSDMNMTMIHHVTIEKSLHANECDDLGGTVPLTSFPTRYEDAV
jgi:hypothetical protein